METILNFLKEKYAEEVDNSEELRITAQEVDKFNQLFKNFSVKETHSKKFSSQPRIQHNQIWSVKNEYFDFLGNKQKAPHPFIVWIINEPSEILDEGFVRINVISPFIEIASLDDLVCMDSSVLGFPFLVETWNDQPLMIEILEEYLGYFEPVSRNQQPVPESLKVSVDRFSSITSQDLNKYQFEFRNIEISRAKYLNNSVNALLSFLDKRQAKDSGVVITMLNEPQFPKFYVGQQIIESNLALAAKSGLDFDDKYIYFKSLKFKFEIYIRKNEDGFIISINKPRNLKLLTSDNKEIQGISNNEKTVYSNLKKGLFTLITEQIPEPITIRLK